MLDDVKGIGNEYLVQTASLLAGGLLGRLIAPVIGPTVGRIADAVFTRASGGLEAAERIFTAPASSAVQGARLGEHLGQLEKYGAQGFTELESGSVRYFGDLKLARTPGEMAGTRVVREWDPVIGTKQTWLETLDHNGTIRIVRPETGGPKVHYVYDANGNFVGTR